MIASVLFLSLFIFLIPSFSLDGSFMVVVVAFRSSSSTLFLILFSYLLLMNSYTYWNELTIAYSETGLLLSLLVFLSLPLLISLTVARIVHCDVRSHLIFFLSHLRALFVVWFFSALLLALCSSHSLNFYRGITHLNAHNRILSSFHTNRLPIYTYHSAPFLSILMSILHSPSSSNPPFI